MASPTSSLQRAPEGISEGVETVRSDQRQSDGDRLAKADRARNRRAAQHDRRKKRQLDAERLVVLDPVAAQAI